MAVHLYWRLNITANNGDVSFTTIAEIEMRATVGGADQCTGGTATASSSEPTRLPEHAFDNSSSSRWTTLSGNPTGWIRYQFASAVDVLEYTIQAHTTSLERAPKDWTFEYSDDGSAWTVVDTRTDSTAWAVGEIRTFAVAEPTLTSQGQTAAGAASTGVTATASTSQAQTTAAGTITSDMAGTTSQGQSATAVATNVTINGDVTLAAVTLSATTLAETITTGNSFFPELAVGGSLEPAMALNQLTLWATGTAGTLADGLIYLNTLAVNGGVDEGSVLEELVVAASGYESAVIAGDVVFDDLECAGSLEPAMALEEYTLAAIGHSGVVANGSVVLEELVVAGFEGTAADLVLENLVVDAVAINGNVSTGAVVFDKLAVNATHFQNTTASGDITLALYSTDGVMAGVNLINGSVTISALALDAVAVSGTVSTGLITIPLVEVDALGHFSTIGSATIALPVFSLDGRMSQSGATTVYTTVALNTQIRAVSTYEGVAFNSFAQFAGLTLAASADGIVALVGDTDLGVDIDAVVASGVTDFGMREIKQVLTGYVGYRAGGNLEVTLITDQHHEYSYVLRPREDAADIHASRVKFGRGVKGRYWQWKLANRSGADFDIDMLTLDISPSVRRV